MLGVPILDLSKIEAGRMELQLEDFALAPLIDGVVKTIEPLAAKNDNRVAISCDAAIGTLHADSMRLRQALLNLMSNANKFTERGTLTVEVRQAQENGRDWVTIAVADSGIGMTPAQMGKLFQEFSQAEASTTRKYGGTGLGLAISKRFCQMMGGDITAKARAEKRHSNRGSLPTHLPRLDVTIEPEDTNCPCCRSPMHRIGEETSERLDVVPAQFRVIVTGRCQAYLETRTWATIASVGSPPLISRSGAGACTTACSQARQAYLGRCALSSVTDAAHSRPRYQTAANHALQRRNLGFVFLEEIGSLGVFVQGTGFNPDVQALAGNKLLRDLPLELDAVGTLSDHDFHPLKAQLTLSNH
jgi:hypothetical protein